ncbi:MAG: hypothetical protein IJC16_10080 [Rikenellaceae bacterium]|nr:hypothetical protein [Rikenellaceae bacterium]
MKPQKHILPRLCLLLLFLGYCGSATMFPHVHLIGNQRIVHSHPYAAGTVSNPGHTHPATAFLLIQQLTALLFAVAGPATLPHVYRKLIGTNKPAEDKEGDYRRPVCYGLRAPPCAG